MRDAMRKIGELAIKIQVQEILGLNENTFLHVRFTLRASEIRRDAF